MGALDGIRSHAMAYLKSIFPLSSSASTLTNIIEQGTAISPDTPISFHYTRNFRPSQSLIVEDELIACGSDSAPPSRTKTLSTVCTLRTDLAAVPESLFTKLKTSKGQEFLNLDFELVMRILSADLVFELRVGGVGYGVVQAEFH